MFIESQLNFEEDVDAELLRQIKAEILEKSSGIFLWVNLVVHQLNEVQRQDGRLKAVQQRLREIPEAVKNRPAPNGAMPLYGLFQDIVQKDGKNVENLVRITQIIFCARRPLHLKELYVLLHQEYNVPFDSSEISYKILTKQVLEVSKGLAEVTKSAQPTVQFIHETVREFLRDGGLKFISTQSVDRDGHEIMKASCLKQICSLVSEHLKLVAEYRHRGQFRNTQVHQVTHPRQIKFQKQANEKFPFLEYASENVLFHAENAEAMGLSQREFLESFPIADWVLIYNLFQHYDTKRFSGTTTPMLYILARHGCDHLIRSSAEFRGQYAREVKDNEFPSALACAIHNGHLDTAWTLVGLQAKNRPQEFVSPRRDYDCKESSLIRLLLAVGDVHLMRKVLEDRHAMNDSVIINIDFELVKSAEMIDLFLEFAVVPEFPSVGFLHGQPRAVEAPRSNSDLIFIRQALKERPSLLESEAWGGKTMLDYAVRQRLQSLLSLYLEYSNGDQSELDAVLNRGAAEGLLCSVRIAYQSGANLGSQNEDGRTALHLAAGHYARYDCHGSNGEATLRYLLALEPSCVNVRDCDGQTALAIAAHFLQSTDLLETFLEAGADANTLIKCRECETHQLPLLSHIALRGDTVQFQIVASDDQCNLNGRDSFGRTALSWSFAHWHRHKCFGDDAARHYEDVEEIGKQLLQRPAVDVNSRDDSGYTILEHFIRHPYTFRGGMERDPQSLVQMFFHSTQLDPNLWMSNNQTPLELIVSLYNTWPPEFSDVYSEWCILYEASHMFRRENTNKRSQQDFNQHLIETLVLLLGTGKVDIDVQRRCAEQAAPELKCIILSSMESTS